MDPSEPTITQPTVEQKGTDMPPVATAEVEPTPAVTPEPAVTPVVAAPAQNGFVQMLMENKKFVAIGVTAVVAVIIGLSVLIGAKSSDEYQGLIKRIDSQTQELNKASQTNISSPSAADSSVDSSSSTIDNSIPFEMEGTPAVKVAR